MCVRHESSGGGGTNGSEVAFHGVGSDKRGRWAVATWNWTSPRTSKPLTAPNLIGLLGLFAGLCSVFALIVTASDAWQERAQQSWPEATAIIERQSVDSYHPFKSAGGGT